MPCVEGNDRSPCEAHWEDTGLSCSHISECGPGEVCGHDGVANCFGGDPHGNNLVDWLAQVANARQESQATYWITMMSSPCVGLADDSYPFEGGYRGD